MPPRNRLCLANTRSDRFGAVESWDLTIDYVKTYKGRAKGTSTATYRFELAAETPAMLSWEGKGSGTAKVDYTVTTGGKSARHTGSGNKWARGPQTTAELQITQKGYTLNWPGIECRVKCGKDTEEDEVGQYGTDFPIQKLPVAGDFEISGTKTMSNETWKWKLTPKMRAYTDYELRLRAFIPAPVVVLDQPHRATAHSGDDRSFDYAATSYRAHQQLVLTLDPSCASPIHEGPEYKFGITKTYDLETSTQPVPGKPWWWRELKAGRVVKFDKTQLVPTADNSLVEVNETYPDHRAPLNSMYATFSGHAVIPSTDATVATFAPAIDWHIVVVFQLNPKTQKPEYAVHALHDGFPAYELYLNQRLIYSYDPSAAGASPLNLFPPEDVRVDDVKFQPIP